MTESFEQAAPEKKADDSQQHAGFTNIVADLYQGLAKKESAVAKKAEDAFDSVGKGSGVLPGIERCVVATGESLAYGVTTGLGHAVKYSFSHPGETISKLGTAFVTGMLMRRYLPERGATKALAGTLMLGYMAWDGLKPMVKGWKEAYNANDLEGAHKAARRMGDGLGMFAFDSATGMWAGMKGDAKMGSFLKSSRGVTGYLTLEASKDAFWNSDRNVVNRGLSRITESLDSALGKAADKVRPTEAVKPLPTTEEVQAALAKSARKGAVNLENSQFWQMGKKEAALVDPPGDGGFYRQGAQDAQGRRIGYSETLDQMLGANKDAADGLIGSAHQEPSRLAGDLEFSAGKTPGKDADVWKDPAEAAKRTGRTRTPRTSSDQPASSDVQAFDKMAAEAKKRQDEWDPLKIAIADYKDGVQGPLWGVIDPNRKVPLYDPIYAKPNQQLIDIANQLTTKEEVEQVGLLLNDHASAALQSELGVKLVKDLNISGEDYIGVLLDGMKKAGIKHPLLEGMAVTKFSVGGTDNYTQPHIFGIVDGAVTKYPRSQVDLRSVFGPINAHEVYGHDGLFPTLAKFSDEQVQTVIGQAVDRAMVKAGIAADATINVPGEGDMPVKDLFQKILIAQRNENTSDIGGTGVTVLGTPDSLVVLLKSLRAGGKLETRSVYGEQFPEQFEAHGLDRWRLLVSAETIRQRTKFAGGDKELEKLADQLTTIADQVSRPGDNYVWASTDKKGAYFAIPRKWWDPVASELVKAQLETPLQSLEGKTLNDILPNMPETWKKMSFLADQMADAAKKGQDAIAVPFNKTDYRPYEVQTAGLLAWFRATEKGGSESTTLDHLNTMFDTMMGQYEIGNPYSVSTKPTPLHKLFTQPVTQVRRGLAASFDMQKATRLNAEAKANRYAGGMSSLLTGDLIRKLEDNGEGDNK